MGALGALESRCTTFFFRTDGRELNMRQIAGDDHAGSTISTNERPNSFAPKLQSRPLFVQILMFVVYLTHARELMVQDLVADGIVNLEFS